MSYQLSWVKWFTKLKLYRTYLVKICILIKSETPGVAGDHDRLVSLQGRGHELRVARPLLINTSSRQMETPLGSKNKLENSQGKLF